MTMLLGEIGGWYEIPANRKLNSPLAASVANPLPCEGNHRYHNITAGCHDCYDMPLLPCRLGDRSVSFTHITRSFINAKEKTSGPGSVKA